MSLFLYIFVILQENKFLERLGEFLSILLIFLKKYYKKGGK